MPTPAPLLAAMRALWLRYFTPAEVAALHGFPASFRHVCRPAVCGCLVWHPRSGTICRSVQTTKRKGLHQSDAGLSRSCLTAGRALCLSIPAPGGAESPFLMTHCFVLGRRFPPHLTLKQRYALLGNSLSVDVVASLLRYLFEDQQSDI